MNAIMEWISQLELSTIHIVSIVIFFLYILLSGIGVSLIYASGRGYMDLARGLRRILERQESNDQLDDIDELSGEIQKYYDSYCKLNPAVSQRYSGIIGWMDDILLQTNMFSNSSKKKKKNYGIWFDEYYDTLLLVQQKYEQEFPYYRCTPSQSQILEDIAALNGAASLINKTEEEFIRLNLEGKKNERSNYISIAIGVAGILVSVLLTVLQMFG